MSENSASAVESRLTEAAQSLLEKVRNRYLDSQDFNGLHVKGGDVDLKVPAEELLQSGLVQVVSFADFSNPHIRPWVSKRTIEDQLLDIRELSEDDPHGFCLYPTSFAMEDVTLPKKFDGRPFHVAMARGKGTLEIAYFDFEVLGNYRDSSIFNLDFGDSGASISVRDSQREHALERDRIYLNYIGYGYNLPDYNPDDPSCHLVRRVAVFYTDLLNLTPEIQRRWESHQVDSEGMVPHPDWWNRQMGNWSTAMGPFDKLFLELSNINELCMMAFEEPLFRSAERPEELGWIIRPSSKEWNHFADTMDKVLSDNLKDKFFNKVGMPNKDPEGNILRELKRFALFLQDQGLSKSLTDQVLAPFHTIRKLRNKRSHSFSPNDTDLTIVRKQVDLLREVNQSVEFIRYKLSKNPACITWENQWEGFGTWII